MVTVEERIAGALVGHAAGDCLGAPVEFLTPQRIAATYGFMDEPDVPELLRQVRHPELEIREDEISYFLGRETLLATGKPGMALWRERLFTWMSRNAQTATAFFNLPPNRVIELGVQVEL